MSKLLPHLVFCLLLSSCGGGGGGGEGAPFSVGAAGGTFRIGTGPLGGTVLEVLPGSVLGPLNLSFFEGVPTDRAGFTAVGPTVVIGPSGTVFDPPARLTLPFDVAMVPAGLEGELGMDVRDGLTGEVSRVRASDIRIADGMATFPVRHLSSFWVTAPDRLETTIGPDGGVIFIGEGPLAGTRLEIVAGSLSSEMPVTVTPGSPTIEVGNAAVGPAVLIGPPGIVFDPPALLTLPFDRDEVAPTIGLEEYGVGRRVDPDSETSLSTPTRLLPVLGFADTSVDGAATFWVSVPDNLDPFDYFPLFSGDSYRFAPPGNLRLTIQRSDMEPNLEGIRLLRVLFQGELWSKGIYLEDDVFSGIRQLGKFGSEQEVWTPPPTLLDTVSTVGDTGEHAYRYEGFDPGSTDPAFAGSGGTLVEIERRTAVRTSLGTFSDVIVVSIESTYQDDSPSTRTGTDLLRLWLARGVGPVRVQFGDVETTSLVEGTVSGTEVVGR